MKSDTGARLYTCQIIFFDIHQYQYETYPFGLVILGTIYLFILNLVNSDNNQPNDNSPNCVLKMV